MKNLYNALQLKQLYQLRNLGYRYTSIKPFSLENKNPLSLPNNLVELKKQAQNCHLCTLSKSRTNTVFGEGDIDAKIMFIGDMPMELEDREGRIFLGRGGEMLRLMIEKVLKLSMEEVYITNLLKCHSLEKQKPNELEFHTCRAYLFKEIELVKPKSIITFGELAYQYLTNDYRPFSEIRGVVTTYNSIKLIPTYHPNFLLRNPSFKREVLMDLKK